MHAHPSPRSAIRTGLVELAQAQRYTHGMTLNTDRELSLSRLRSIFGTFCHMVDREILGAQNVRNVPSELRFNAIAFPEHLETNAHLHVLGDLGDLLVWRTERELSRLIYRVWRKSTRGAGSVDVQKLHGDGYAWYATKDLRGTDPTYFLSSDYHPR